MKPRMTTPETAPARSLVVQRVAMAACLGLAAFAAEAGAARIEEKAPTGIVAPTKGAEPREIRWRRVAGGRVRPLRGTEADRLARKKQSFLLEAPAALAAMAAGAPTVKLYVPTTGGQGVALDFDLVQVAEPDVEVITRSGIGGVASVTRNDDLVFYVYASRDDQMRRTRNGGVARAVVQAGNPLSLTVKGVAGTKKLRRFSAGAVAADELDFDLRPRGTGEAGGVGLVVETGPLTPSLGDAAEDCQQGDPVACQNYCWQADAHGTCDPDLGSSSCCEPFDDGDPGVTSECNTPGDDDGDGLTNSADPDCNHTEYCDPDLPGVPDHIHRYEGGVDIALFGEIAFCSKRKNTWATELWTRASQIRSVYRQSSGNAAYDHWLFPGGGKPVRIAVIGCWVLDDVDDAEDCRDDGGAACAPFGPGATHEYPYAGFGASHTAYSNFVFLDVWHGTTKAGLETPLSAAHVVVDVPSFDSPTVAGIAEDNYGFGSTARWTAGYQASAHEIGHTLDLNHCHKSVLWSVGETDYWSIMASEETSDCGSVDFGPTDQEAKRLGPLEGGALFQSMVLGRTIFPAGFGNHADPDWYD